MGNNDPNWRTHIFQRGRYTTNQNALCFWKSRQVLCQQRPYSGFQLRGFLAPGVWQLTCWVRLGSEESKIEKLGLNTHVLKHLWTTTGWWFGTFFIFPNTWDDDPIWLIFFKMVETTNQMSWNHQCLILGCMDVSKRFKKGMNIGIDPSYFAVKQGNMGFWFIKYYQVLYQLFSTAFDQHEIQLRASFMSNLREISQRAVVKRLFAKSRKRWWCVTCHCIKVFGFSREILKVS